MSRLDDAPIRFTLNGRRYELTRAQVEARLADAAPEAIHKHAVRVNNIWFPAVQAFEAAVGVSRSEFISHTARRHLAALGFELQGEIKPRGSATDAASTRMPGPDEPTIASPEEEWHTEANVQAAVVTALAHRGWRILSVANTAAREHGIDVIARGNRGTVGIEVKGFPSRSYADSRRAHEIKRTSPSTQAGHWFAAAVLAAMRLRGKEPHWQSAIALPECQRYRDLYGEVTASLSAAQIDVWWVHADGTVELS
jgi:Holliday junction resolvase-like predicted endonuclease